MAVVSATALLVALGLAALLVLQPWKADSVAPHLSLAPELGIGLGDAAVVSPSRQPAVAPARPAGGDAPRSLAAPVAGEGESQLRVGLAVAQVVTTPGSIRTPEGPPGQPAPETPAPASPGPILAPAPVSAPAPESPPPPAPVMAGSGGEATGPVTSGGGPGEGGAAGVIEVCAGDDYTLPLSPVQAAEGSEALPPVVSHDLTVIFGSAGEEADFYLVLFDGRPVEIGDDPFPVEPGRSCAPIDLGPLLGESIEAGAEIHVEAVALGEASEPVVP